MKIFNTLSRKLEPFNPIKPNHVSMYVCGPTVYDVGHLGHARSAISFDIIRRYFLYKGFTVKFVSNITDVDDKMIKRAREEGITEKALAEKIIPEYEKDYAALGVLPPTEQPRATEYISKMVALIEKLIQKGVAYKTEDGIYFEVCKYKKYGKLSGQNLDELRAGARVDVDEKKKNPEDFALWKAAKPGEPKWEGPMGISGRPGWHIECSAMSMDILGETFDIHGGGIDLLFPHHEDELAQSEMATGKPFARYWLHNGHIKVNKEKMSKSLGNFFTIKEILAKYNPAVVRYFLLSTHYRLPIDFSDELLVQAKNGLERLHDFIRRLKNYIAPSGAAAQTNKLIHNAKREFEVAMDNDFSISQALGTIFDFVKKINTLVDFSNLFEDDKEDVLELIDDFDMVFAIFHAEGTIDEEIEKLIAQRNSARAKKDFKRSDEIRAQLEKKGIILEDTPTGTLWKKSL